MTDNTLSHLQHFYCAQAKHTHTYTHIHTDRGGRHLLVRVVCALTHSAQPRLVWDAPTHLKKGERTGSSVTEKAKQQQEKKKKSLRTIVFAAAARHTLEPSNSLRSAFSSRVGLRPQVHVGRKAWGFKKEKTVRLWARSSSKLPSVRRVLLLFPQLCLCCCLAEYLSSSVSLSAFSG